MSLRRAYLESILMQKYQCSTPAYIVLELKKYFLSSYFVGVFFIKDGMFYEVVYNRESPSRIIRKVRFIRC